MSEKSSNESFQAVVDALRSAKSLVAVTHVHPDGDALGAMVALGRAGQAAGKRVTLVVPDTLPPRYAFLFDQQRYVGADGFAALADKADLIVVVDTCAFGQLDELAGEIRRCMEKVVVIDHHLTCDEVSSTQWIDATASAAGLMVAELLEALDWCVDLPTAEALATAVLTDTGWLRFANTDARTLRCVARLVDLGVRLDELYRRIYQSDRPERLRLMARVLDNLELHCDEKLAVMTLGGEDFKQTGARLNETENLINEAMRLGSVIAAVLLIEQTDGVRASLRSRGEIDVADIAKRFDGGGHARAAGCGSTDNLETFKQQLITACREAMGS